MAAESFVKSVDELANDAVNISIGSIDYVLNAKAIALMDPEVKRRIVETLDQGYRLVDIGSNSAFGSSLMDFRVAFRFEPSEKVAKDRPAIDVRSPDFEVSVELPTKAVRAIQDFSGGGGSMDVPFSVAFPNRNAYRVVPLEATAGRRQREADFYVRSGLRRGPTGWDIDPPPIDDPMGGGIGPGRGGGIVINPGGGLGSDTTTYDTTPTYTSTKTENTTGTRCESGSDSISNNVVDDTVIDEEYRDDDQSEGSTNDDQDWDGDTGDNPHPDNDVSMWDLPVFGGGFGRPGLDQPGPGRPTAGRPARGTARRR